MTEPVETLAAGAVNLQVFTSPHAAAALDPEPALVALIHSAKTALYFSAYSFTLPDVAAAIVTAHKRGVAVTGVLDTSELAGTGNQAQALLAGGVTNLRQWGGQYNLAHEKVAVVDPDTPNSNCAVGLGSYNWSASAEKSNKEVFVIISGIQVSRVAGPTFRDQILQTYAVGKPIQAGTT